MNKTRIELSVVPETLLIPLYFRVVESRPLTSADTARTSPPSHT